MERTNVHRIVGFALCFLLTWMLFACWQAEFLLQRQLASEPSSLPTSLPSPLFPPYIFRTSKSLDMYYKTKRYVELCEIQNPLHQSFFYNDEECRQFVHAYYPEFADAYDRLPAAVMRADVWRYLVIHRFGGFYMDTDVQCRKPIDRWGQELRKPEWFGSRYLNHPEQQERIQAMVGVEFCNCTSNHGHSSGTVQFVQWIFGAQPNHPILYRAAQIAIANAQLPNATDPLTVTGPVVFSQSVLEYFVQNAALEWDQITWARGEGETHQVKNVGFINCRQHNTLVGDVVVLNKQAFGYHAEHVNSADWNSTELFVEHHFSGAWRKRKQ